MRTLSIICIAALLLFLLRRSLLAANDHLLVAVKEDIDEATGGMAKSKRPVCQVCASKRWHRDALSGGLVCEEGHVLKNYVQESLEKEITGPHALQFRRLKKSRSSKDGPSRPVQAVWHGPRAEHLRLQAFQLLLRMQVKAMVELGFPQRLEEVVRELWALYVAGYEGAGKGGKEAPMVFWKGEEEEEMPKRPRMKMKTGRKKKDVKGKGKETTDDESLFDGGESQSEAASQAGSEAAQRRRSRKRKAKEAEKSYSDKDAAARYSESETGTRASGSGSGSGSSSEDSDSDVSHYRPSEDEQEDEETGGGSGTDASRSTRRSRSSKGSNKKRRRSSRSARRSVSPARPGEDSSESDGEDEDEGPVKPTRRRTRRAREVFKRSGDPRKYIRWTFSLMFLYLGCLLLKVPVFLKDILELAASMKIPALHAWHYLPPSILAFMEEDLKIFFDMREVYLSKIHYGGQNNRGSEFRIWLTRLVRMYKVDWDITFPEPNVPPLVWRLSRSLALPPRMYVATKALLRLLPYFSFQLPTDNTRYALTPPEGESSDATSSEEFESSSSESGTTKPPRMARPKAYRWPVSAQNGRGHLPELRIGAALVVLVRLWLGDEMEGAGSERVRTWLDTLDRMRRTPGALSLSEHSQWITKEALDMDSDEVDRFLDFCEDKLIWPDALKTQAADITRANTTFPTPDDVELAPAPSGNDELAKILRAFCGESDLFSAPLDLSSDAAKALTRYKDVESLYKESPALGRVYDHVVFTLGGSPSALLFVVGLYEQALANRESHIHQMKAVAAQKKETASQAREVRELWKGEMQRRKEMRAVRRKAQVLAKDAGVRGRRRATTVKREMEDGKSDEEDEQDVDEFGNPFLSQKFIDDSDDLSDP